MRIEVIVFPGPCDPGLSQHPLQTPMTAVMRAHCSRRGQEAWLYKHAGPKESFCVKLRNLEKYYKQRSLYKREILIAIKYKWNEGY